MTCLGRYAEAWQFAAFFCVSGFVQSADNSGGAGNAFLTDTQVNFVNLGIQANVGMLLYNVTTGLSGVVTAVTSTTLTAAGVTWDNGHIYRIAALNSSQRSTIEMYLDITAADINAARAAQDACDCTLQSWALAYLQKLNIIEASAFYNCPCGQPNISDEQQQAWLTWATEQLVQLRDGNIPLCEGDTGKTYPAFGIAEIAYTPWQEEEIADNYQRRHTP